MIRCLIAFAILSVPCLGQSIVTSSGGRSIVMSGRSSGTVVAKAKPVVRGPSLAEIDELRMEIDFLRSSLEAATAPVIVKPTPPTKPVVKSAVIKTGPLRMSWNIQGDWSPSESETREHLQNDHGVSTAGMTHQQMLSLHDSLHNGTKTVSKAVSKPVVYAQSSCPGGVCPINQVRQSGGRSRRSRR